MSKGNFKVILDKTDNNWFGKVGSICEVKSGVLINSDGDKWLNSYLGFNNVQEINTYFCKSGHDIIFSEYKPPYNGKFRVVRNIGSRSSEVIGKVGDVIEVKDGVFKSKTGTNWGSSNCTCKIYYTSFQDIKRHLEERDRFKTEIEEVEEEQDAFDRYMESYLDSSFFRIASEKFTPTFDIGYIAKKCESPRDMTVEEIEKELGYSIRIVSSKEVK